MKTLDEIYQDYLDMPYYERVSQGKREVETIKRYLERALNKSYGSSFSVTLLFLCRNFIGVDGEFSFDEYEYLRDVFEINNTYNELLDGLNLITIDQRMTAQRTIRNIPEDIKFSILRFAILICVADGVLTVSEKREIEKFL